MRLTKIKTYALAGALSALVISALPSIASARLLIGGQPVTITIFGQQLTFQSDFNPTDLAPPSPSPAPPVPLGGKGNLHNVTTGVGKTVRIQRLGNGLYKITSGTISVKLSPSTGQATYYRNVAFTIDKTKRPTSQNVCNVFNGTSPNAYKIVYNYPKTTAKIAYWGQNGYIKSGIDTKNPGPYKSDNVRAWPIWTYQPTLNQIPKITTNSHAYVPGSLLVDLTWSPFLYAHYSAPRTGKCAPAGYPTHVLHLKLQTFAGI